ncbi:MAG: hypothetical protein HY873_09745, partial [Chloroflexi bacterium]|nr:hypothetical protein [Chloroflexota bacterium]
RGRRIVVEASSGAVRSLLTIDFDTVTAKGPLRMTAAGVDQAQIDAAIQFRTSEVTVKFPVKGGELTAEGSGVLRANWQLLLAGWADGPCVAEATFTISLRGTASGATLAGTGSSLGTGVAIITGCDKDDGFSSDSDPFRFEGTYDEPEGKVTLRIYDAEDDSGELYILFLGVVQ